MTEEPKDVIEQLERRVAALETIVRRLTSVAHTAERPQRVSQPVRVAPAAPTPRPAPPTRSTSGSSDTDLEQWFGQRGLLAVGVAALLVAAAFFLKYAFDRGWISPLLRSLGAIVLGIGVAAWGHERIGRGMRRYGAALIGAGGGLAYLGLWAAAGPYALIERRIGILLLAATTIAVTMLALHHEIEGLAIWALSGAYLAPIILATAPNPMGFLGYLEVIGLGTGILAYAMSWRWTFNLALFGYLALAMTGAAEALGTPAGCWLVAAGGVLTLHVTYHRPWPEARVVMLLLAWSALGTGTANLEGPPAARWLALGGAATIFALLWWQQLSRRPFVKDAPAGVAFAEQVLFIANPIVFLILADATDIRVLQRSPETVPAALGFVYLAAGWHRVRVGRFPGCGLVDGAGACGAGRRDGGRPPRGPSCRHRTRDAGAPVPLHERTPGTRGQLLHALHRRVGTSAVCGCGRHGARGALVGNGSGTPTLEAWRRRVDVDPL